jgi:hypothetical protein
MPLAQSSLTPQLGDGAAAVMRPRCVAPLLAPCRSSPSFAKDGRFHLIDLPIEKVVIARPRVHPAPANVTAECAGMLVGMMLPCRGVRQPAVGAAKIFGRPYIACHTLIMRSIERIFQRSSLP